MHKAIVQLSSLSPMSQSRYCGAKSGDETHEDFEKRIWRERVHTDAAGNVLIPQMAMKKSLQDAAAYLSMKVSEKGRSTFTKRFKGGVMIFEPIPLGVTIDEFDPEWIFADAGGGKGGAGKSTRVHRCYPTIQKWSATCEIIVQDVDIKQKVLQKHLDKAGMVIGLGRFRAEVGGLYGRFRATIESWDEFEF